MRLSAINKSMLPCGILVRWEWRRHGRPNDREVRRFAWSFQELRKSLDEPTRLATVTTSHLVVSYSIGPSVNIFRNNWESYVLDPPSQTLFKFNWLGNLKLGTIDNSGYLRERWRVEALTQGVGEWGEDPKASWWWWRWRVVWNTTQNKCMLL
jgi:hypothetical protein